MTPAGWTLRKVRTRLKGVRVSQTESDWSRIFSPVAMMTGWQVLGLSFVDLLEFEGAGCGNGAFWPPA